MNEATKQQEGSPTRDRFKLRHKQLASDLYACDLDFVLVIRDPSPDVLAVLDFKTAKDKVGFSETIAYNAMIRRGIPVYIVQGDPESGKFEILQYIGGHHRQPRQELKQVATTEDWQQFEQWERSLRQVYIHTFKQ